MANRFPLVLDTTDGNKIKELPADDNLNLRENSIVNVQDITALGTIDAADIRVAGNRIVAQAFADLTDTPSSFAGAPNYFVKVKADGTGLEYRPLSDLGNIEIDTITVDTSIVPSTDGVGNLGSDSAKFDEVVAATLKGNLAAFDDSIVFNATTGKISYAALQGAPTFLSEFTDDVGYLRAVDLDDSLAGLFDEGQQFVTDIQGSVFADDSTLLVDAVAGKIVGDIDFGTTAGFIEGDEIVILPTEGNTVDIGTARLLDTLTPQNVGGGAIGTEAFPFNEANFISINTDSVATDAVNLSEAIGVAQLTASTDLDITAGNRVKILGGVPFKFSSVTTSEQLAIGAQEGDVIYNTTTSRLQMYQGSEWKDVNGNTEITTGESTFNDVVIAGNLTVSGTTTTVDTTNTTISDNVITLNEGEVGVGITNTTAGIEIDRGSESNVSFVYDDSVDKWTLGSETLVAGDIEADSFEGVAVRASLIDNNGGPLQIKAGDVSDTGNVIFINPYGSDTYINSTAETHFWGTGPYLDAGPNPYVQFKTAGAFEAKDGAYFDGNLIGDVTGSVFADDSAVMVDAVGNELTANKVNTQTVEGTSLILLSQAGINATATTSALMRSLDGDFTIDAAGGWAQLTGNGGNANVSVNGDTGEISIGSTASVNLIGGAGAPINIGTSVSGTVTLGNGTNTIDIASGSTADFTGATVTGLATNLTGNIDNTTLTVGATDATTITIGNSGSTTSIAGNFALTNALVVNNITADDSISITTATGDGNGISLGPQGTNTAINLTADSIRLFGSVTTNIEAQAGVTGDLKGSVAADDSTILVDAVNGKIVGPVEASVAATSLTIDTVPSSAEAEWLMYNNSTGLVTRSSADPGAYIGSFLQATGLPVNTLMTGTLDAQSNDITDANLVNATGNMTGDIVGSVFSDDSSVMVDAVDFAMFSDTISLTPLNTEPANPVNGMIAVADGTGWDPASNAKNTLVAYLGGAWVTIAAAA